METYTCENQLYMQAHSFESVRMRKSSTKSLTVNQAGCQAKSPIMEQYNIEPLNTRKQVATTLLQL